MKKTLILVCFLVVCLGLVVSCATAGAIMRSNFEGRPVWYYIPENQIKKDRTVFLGEGRAVNERQARLLALTNLFENVEFYFGTDLSEEYYRELTVLQTIADYDLTVVDIDTYVENGAYNVILRATASTKIIEELRTDGALTRQETLDKIESLVSQGVEYMKSQQDLSAVKKYMEAMLLAWDNSDVDEDYSFESLLAECHSILSSVDLNVSNINSSEASCTVYANIREGKLLSVVPDCPVIATYSAVGVNGEVYEDSFYFSTDITGSFGFVPVNYSMVRKGTVVFSLDFSNEIESLEKKAGKDAVAVLRQDYESKKASFDYDLVYTDNSVGLVLMDFDITGESLGSYLSGEYLINKFKSAGIATESYVYDSSLDNGEIIELYRQSRNGKTGDDEPEYLFISRIAETDSIISETGAYVISCEGSYSVYRTDSGELVKGSEMIYATAFGETEQEAKQEAFYNLADLFFSFIRSIYV